MGPQPRSPQKCGEKYGNPSQLTPDHSGLGINTQNYLFWGNQTVQFCGNFEGIPKKKQCIVWVGNIMTLWWEDRRMLWWT